MNTMLLLPLEDLVVFPNMNVTLPLDVDGEDRVLLVPRHEGSYARVGTVAEVLERVRLPGGATAVALSGLHRGIAGAAQTDARGNLRVEVEERPDENPPAVKIRELEREYRAIVEEILELRGDDGRISSFVRSITEPGALACPAGPPRSPCRASTAGSPAPPRRTRAGTWASRSTNGRTRTRRP